MAFPTTSLVFGSAVLGVLFLLTVLPHGAWSQTDPASSSTEVQQSFLCPNGSTFVRPEICPTKKNKTLYILGFVPATNGVFESDNIIPAAYAALDEINANCSILGDYALQIDFVNTMCNPSEATWQLIDSIILSNTSRKITFLGGGCSLATEPVAALSGRFYKIPQISYGASSPSLSQQNMFPRFVRTIPSEIQANMARFGIMKKYDWTRVATLHETQTIFSLAVNDFHQRYDLIYNTTAVEHSEEEENLIPRSFTDDPEIPLSQIKEREIRIIFGYFYEDKANTVVCQAIRMNLFTENHFWAFPAWFTYGWWDKEYIDSNGKYNCTRLEMNQAVNLSFFLDSYNYGMNRILNKPEPNLFTESNSRQFDEKYDCYNNEFRTNPETRNLTRNDSRPHIYRTFSYDAVYVIAESLHITVAELTERRANDPAFNLSLDDYVYFDDNNVSTMITDNMRRTDFNGITGRVRFDENGTRLGLNAIYQLVLPEDISERSNASNNYVLLAVHNPYEGFNVTSDSADFNTNITYLVNPLWKSGKPPKDRRTPRNKYLNSNFVHVCQAFTTIAIIIVIALIVFNNVTLFKPLIRDSAPHINTVILVGCLVMLVTCYLLSVDTANPPINSNTTAMPDNDLTIEVLGQRNSRYGMICTARLWLLTIAFTLSFGALFAKTWQVYRVYTNPKLQKEPFKMWNFLIFMGIFLFIDVAYLIFWTVVYPFTRATTMTTDDSNDVDNIYEMCQCAYFPYLVGALYVYKGLLVVFGLFLAYESRNVKYYYINDSRFVSISMYIVVILVGIGAPLSLVLAVHNFIDPAYGLAVFMIITSTMSCVLILYIPKFVFMARGKETMVRENAREEVTVSDGLQLGRTTMDQTEVRTVEEEVTQLKEENEKKDQEIRHLENGLEIKPRNGSDGDSGVLVTADENDVFSTESTANGDTHHRTLVATPSSGEEEGSDGRVTAESV